MSYIETQEFNVNKITKNNKFLEPSLWQRKSLMFVTIQLNTSYSNFERTFFNQEN